MLGKEGTSLYGYEDLKTLLGDKSTLSTIGVERGRTVKDGISRYESREGSIRYVLREGDKPVGALQVVVIGPRTVQIANIYVLPSYRRLGIARELFEKVQRDFREVRHSIDLSPLGRRFVEGIERS
jgi:ribosomal protein S18 acetylase RimI-like enzyme